MSEERKKRETPLLDELESGPWPSFVKEIKKADTAMADDLLGVLERSYEEKIGHWKHGGLVGVMGYGGGVIGRYSDLPQDFPEVAEFHTIRVNQPAGWFYTSDALRTIAGIWERHGSGMTNMHGSTGDIVLLGCKTQELEPVFAELTAAGFDLGGSGSDMRTPSCCVGQARCEWACYDTMGACYDFTQTYQDELHRPAFPYKYKLKFSGCPNDCVASVARSDMSFIGVWRDEIKVDAEQVKAYAAGGKLDIQKDVCDRCPTGCMKWDGAALEIDNANCVKCMHCINAMPKALAPGDDRGAAILIGAKAPIVGGALLASVFVPFIKMEPPYEDIKELLSRIWDLWAEHGKNRERVGEFIQRVGLGNFLEQIGLDPVPEMITAPRANPYIFYQDTVEDEA
ncbi:MAG: dissimilatory-type sulfite reductase subunit alpha [Thermoanaerobaculaceae bacterium]|nr:dissimilatory-type sulfite reductase subunit alpha [Thermoanaerobaculaceae bacterium]TAM46953.1 MAG: dissimilatory-type sulfite reductase subunit alpha [Acidobacteriota bacterium]